MGLSYLVLSRTDNTRFEHALGSLYLMQKGIHSIRKKSGYKWWRSSCFKGCNIFTWYWSWSFFSCHRKYNNSKCSTRKYFNWNKKLLNKQWKVALKLALSIFTNTYHRKFMHQLIASQIDMDWLDYLKRDSFLCWYSKR